MNPELLTTIVTTTINQVGLIIFASVFGSALGWTLICSKFIEGITRQPELRTILQVQMFITGGLMESFPFIGLAIAMWFIFANPFVGATLSMMAAMH